MRGPRRSGPCRSSPRRDKMSDNGVAAPGQGYARTNMTAVVDVDDHPSVDHSSASNASTLIDLGVSGLRALGISACARRRCDRRIQPPGKNHARARRTGGNPVTRAPARTPTGPQMRRCRRRCRCCRRCSTHLTTRHLRPSRRCCRDSTRHRAGRAGSCHAPPPGGCCRTSSPWFCRRVPFGLEAGPTRHRCSRNPIRSRSLVPFTG